MCIGVCTRVCVYECGYYCGISRVLTVTLSVGVYLCMYLCMCLRVQVLLWNIVCAHLDFVSRCVSVYVPVYVFTSASIIVEYRVCLP